MEFREIGDRRSLQRPSIEEDDLRTYDAPLKGELSLVSVLVDGGGTPRATGEGSLVRSRLAGTGLAETVFGPLEIADAALDGVDLSNARWTGVRLSRTELTGCRGVGWQLAIAEAGDVYAEDCRFDMALVRLERTRSPVVFNRVSFQEAVFTGRLDQVVFLDCDLSGAEFEVVSARGADLRGSRLEGARGLLSLRGATLSPVQAVEAAGQLASEAGLTIA